MLRVVQSLILFMVLSYIASSFDFVFVLSIFILFLFVIIYLGFIKRQFSSIGFFFIHRPLNQINVSPSVTFTRAMPPGVGLFLRTLTHVQDGRCKR